MSKLIHLLKKRQDYLEHLIIGIVERNLTKIEGRLKIIQGYGPDQYYIRNTRDKATYIRKRNINIAKNIAQRDYDAKLKQSIEKELKLLTKYIDLLEKDEIRATFYSQHPLRKKLITPLGFVSEDRVNEFLSQSHNTKAFPENFPTIYSNKGERVRSKSEKIIADFLFQKGIPYLYEKPLLLVNYGRQITVHPDFTLLDVDNDREIYLEHLGMMDNGEYSGKAMEKILLYERNGFFIGDKLLISCETSETPLDCRILENMLKNAEIMV